MVWFIFFLILWAALHSFTASEVVKGWFEARFGRRFVLVSYRIIFNAFSVLSIVPALYFFQSAKSSVIYSIDEPYSYVFNFVRVIGLGLMTLAVKETGLLRFAGLRPQFDGSAGELPPFVRSGIYSIVRHPIYTGTYLVFLADPTMTWNKLTGYIVLSLYLLIGIQFEERRLIQEFGDRYLQYKKEVPMVLPTFKRNNT